MEERALSQVGGPAVALVSIDPRFRHFAALARRTAASGGEEGLFQFTIGLTMIGLGHVDSNGSVQSAIGLG